MPPDQIPQRAARYEIDLPAGCWTVALAQVDSPAEPGHPEREELLLLSVQSFLEDHFTLEGASGRTLLYNDAAALLVQLPGPGALNPLLQELERLRRLAQGYLGLSLTIGVGLPADGPGQQIPQSFSYFDLTPVGYGAWFPMLIGAATVLALILGLLCLWQRNARGLFTAWLACVGIGGALSLLHLLFSALLTGQFSPTIPECGILILLLAACWLVSKARWAMAAPLQHS